MSDYSVLEEPVFFATYTTGEVKEISVRTAFRDAEKIKLLSGNSPIQEFPIHRFLIAILYRAFPQELYDEDGWGELWETSFNIEKIDSYLNKYSDRFILNSHSSPLYQITQENAEYEKTEKNIDNSLLFIELQKNFAKDSNQNPLYYFSKTTPMGVKNIAPGFAFRSLLTLQAYVVASKRSVLKEDSRKKKRGYGQVGWCGNFTGILLVGNNLKETLLLNTVPYSFFGHLYGDDAIVPETDSVVWEKPQQDASPSNETWKVSDTEDYGFIHGPAEAMTLQGVRASLLFDDNNEYIHGTIVGIGDRLFPQNQYAEPLSPYRTKTEKNVTTRSPTKLYGRAWQNLNSLLAFTLPTGEKKQGIENSYNVKFFQSIAKNYYGDSLVDIKTVTVFYGTQNAVIEEIQYSSIDLPRTAFIADADDNNTLIRDILLSMVSESKNITRIIVNLKQNIDKAKGVDTPMGDNALRDEIFSDLENPFQQIAAKICYDNIGQCKAEWTNILDNICNSYKNKLIGTISPSAIKGKKIHETGQIFTAFNALNIFTGEKYKALRKGALSE